MRKWLTIAGGGLMVAACGGGGGSGGGVSVVPAGTPTVTPTPTPTPAATPTPTATPAPTPTPTASYTRFADLTGSRTFQTACASVLLGGTPPTPQPVLSFGEGPTLDTAASGWTVAGDGVSLQFAASDAVASASGQRSYERSVSGSVQRFTIADTVAGITPDYVRSFALRTDRAAGSTLYSCVFGVPAVAADAPTAATSYTRVGVSGNAYVADGGGTVQTYALTASTGTVRFDAATGAMIVSIRLLGNLQTANGTASATTDLGTFTGNAAVDRTRGRFYSQLDSEDRVSLFSSLSGWFFGGTEAGAAFSVLAADPGSGNRVSAVGSVVAAR